MKKLTTLLIFSLATQSYAIDRFVDPNLSTGNGTTLFTNITSAVAAAVNGDRIIVASNTYNEATLTISKSLKIIPQTAGTTINFNANIIIAGFPGMKLEILGFNLGVYSINSLNIVTGSHINRAKISVIECLANNLNFENDYYELFVLKNIFSGNINIKFGNVVQNTMINCNVWDEVILNPSSNNRILISNNIISGRLLYYNSVNKFIVANNILKDILIKRWNAETTIKNRIFNNIFIDGSSFGIAMFDVPFYNIIVTSNKFNGNVSFLTCSLNNAGAYNPIAPSIGSYSDPSLIQLTSGGTLNLYSTTGYSTSTISPNLNVGGFFEWSYNGIDYPYGLTLSSSNPLSITRIIGPLNEINGGNPNHDYYDIDLTINDRGINGGPYSQLNYTPSNPNNSKAFIFDLDMPTDLFPGQNVNITAKGYHKN
jgi:hypothetical protein